MEQEDVTRIALAVRQLQILWLAFAASPPFSATVLLLAIPPASTPAGLTFAAVGLLSALPALLLAPRFRRQMAAYVGGRSTDAGSVQRTLVLGAIAAETPMLVGVAQYALLANAPALLLLCAVSFALLLAYRPRTG